MEKNFEVINGYADSEKVKEKKKEEFLKHKNFLCQKYYDLYLDYQYGFEHEPNLLKTVFYGIKYINKIDLQNISYEKVLKILSEIKDIKMALSFLTYNELINLFPIIKDFDGAKYESKDYFTTKEYLKDKNCNFQIGLKEVDNLLWYYYNRDIMNFSIYELLLIDRLAKFQNKKGLLESFMEEFCPDLPTYTHDKENRTMTNNKTGEITKIKPSFEVITNNKE